MRSPLRLLPYRLAGGVAAAFGLPYLFLRRRSELRERLGYRTRGGRLRPIWIHAASLGEFEAAWPIVRAWGEEVGFENLLLSCTNPIALRRLAERLPQATRRRLAPLDLYPAVRRALDMERPSCLLFVETELWPEWICAAAERSIPLAIVSARLSDRSFPSYRRLRYFLRPILERVTLVSCRTEIDRARWCEIGMPPERCFVWGNTKYDAGPEPSPRRTSAGPGRFVLVAGSMRDGEESILDLPTMLEGRKVRLVVAPRHLERLHVWEKGSVARGLSIRRFSLTGLNPTDAQEALREQLRLADASLSTVLLVDRIGILKSLYRVADAAFVGGTWAPIGGHNLFEPAREGVPVLFGESTTTVRDVAECLVETGGGERVDDVARLADAVRRLADDGGHHERMAAGARQAALRLAGGGERTLAGLRQAGFPQLEKGTD